MHKLRSRGFTLIELLVVIAIIGILSAVVLASLNTARSKGSDAAIKSDLETIRTQAELFYDGAGANTYTGMCTSTSADAGPIVRALAAADLANGGGTSPVGYAGCASTAQTYAVVATLVSNTGRAWCVDSTGNSKEIAAVTAVPASCP